MLVSYRILSWGGGGGGEGEQDGSKVNNFKISGGELWLGEENSRPP